MYKVMFVTYESEVARKDVCVYVYILVTSHISMLCSEDIIYVSSIHHMVYLIYINISGGPLSALTCCVNARLLSAIKKNIAVNLFSKLG